MAEREASQDIERKSLSRKHSLSRDSRGRVRSGHRGGDNSENRKKAISKGHSQTRDP